MTRFAVVVLLVATVAGGAARANATKGWHRCQLFQGYGSLCDGRGRVLFPRLFYRSEWSGYTQVVTGFHRSSVRRATVDTYVNWASLSGECGQHGYIRDCKDWYADEHVRYRTIDGGRHWLPAANFHRVVTKAESPGPGPPVETGRVDDHPPLRPCKWSHAYQDELVHWLDQFGNWCAPVEEWKIPDSIGP